MALHLTWLLYPSLFLFIVKWFDKKLFNNYIAFHWPTYAFYLFTTVLTVFMIPFFIFIDTNNCVNSQRGCVLLRYLSYIVGIKWIVRGTEIMGCEEGCMIVANHQSSFDILGFFWIWRYFYRMAAIAKKEIMYTPFGVAAYLAGVVFIDRSNSQKAKKQLEQTTRLITEERTKLVMFPEGTRNKERSLLPFKKGAFHMAISCQVPIMPIVFSPYYFINPKTNFFERGGSVIITALPLIPTKGLTLDDVDSLKDKVREVMLQKYEEVSEELRAKLPPDYPGLDL